MRPTTTTALALAGTAMALPAGVALAEPDDPPSPTETALAAPFAGHLSVRDHMRAERREQIRAKRRAQRRRAQRAGTAAGANTTAAPHLEAIAACESGGDPSTDTGNGFYGKYQFTQSTWESVGGSGNPAAASEAEQDRRAAMLYAQSGAAPWPVCGR